MPITIPEPDRTRAMDEESWWDLWNSSYRSEDGNDPIASELFAHIAAVVNAITAAQASRVLEIACGAGSLSRLLTYSSYHGLDISPAAIEIARKKSELGSTAGSPRPTYEAADFHSWPAPPEPFDVALCVDAVVCFRDQQFVMNKIAASLCPAGRLVLTAVNPFVYQRIKRSTANPIENGPVSHWLSRHELHTLIKSAGLTIERSYTIMPRGNRGILRLINARRLNQTFGPGMAAALRRLKELAGLGQYQVVVARKLDRA